MIYELTTTVVTIITLGNIAHAIYCRRFRLFVYPGATWSIAFLAALIPAMAGVHAGFRWAGALQTTIFASWLTLIQALAVIDRSALARRLASAPESGGLHPRITAQCRRVRAPAAKDIPSHARTTAEIG